MITEQALQEAIAECQGERHPNANTCLKLAAYYTIRNELYGGYSFAEAPESGEGVSIQGDSEFARAIQGRPQREIWPIIEDLVSTIRVVNPRLYASFMRNLH